MDLEKAGLAPALRQQEHHGRIRLIRIDSRKHLAVKFVCQRIVRRKYEPAVGDEAPSADSLRNEIFEFFASQIVQLLAWTAPRCDAGGRTKQQAERKFAPVDQRLGEVIEDRFHSADCGSARTNNGVAALSIRKMVSNATANINSPAKS